MVQRIKHRPYNRGVKGSIPSEVHSLYGVRRCGGEEVPHPLTY